MPSCTCHFGWYKKASWVSHEEQSSIQCSSMTSASVPACRFLSELLSWLLFTVNIYLQFKEMSAFLKLFLVSILSQQEERRQRHLTRQQGTRVHWSDSFPNWWAVQWQNVVHWKLRADKTANFSQCSPRTELLEIIPMHTDTETYTDTNTTCMHTHSLHPQMQKHIYLGLFILVVHKQRSS